MIKVGDSIKVRGGYQDLGGKEFLVMIVFSDGALGISVRRESSIPQIEYIEASQVDNGDETESSSLFPAIQAGQATPTDQRVFLHSGHADTWWNHWWGVIVTVYIDAMFKVLFVVRLPTQLTKPKLDRYVIVDPCNIHPNSAPDSPMTAEYWSRSLRTTEFRGYTGGYTKEELVKRFFPFSKVEPEPKVEGLTTRLDKEQIKEIGEIVKRQMNLANIDLALAVAGELTKFKELILNGLLQRNTELFYKLVYGVPTDEDMKKGGQT